MRKQASWLFIALALTGCQTRQGVRTQEPFSFGIMADVQYAEKDPSGPRHYRSSLNRLEESVNTLNSHRELLFTIQLGDIIDGNDTPEKTATELDTVLMKYHQLNMPAYHVIGNHCITAGTKELKKKLPLKNLYYDFVTTEAKGWRFVVLNSNDIEPGVVGEEQMEWLRKNLAGATAHGERVIVFSHHALLKEAAQNVRMKNAKDVLSIVENAGCVVAVFAGHDHAGGYALKNGIHHITLRGMLEAPKQNAYAIIKVSPNGLMETGFGKEPNREMPFTEQSAR